MTLPDNEGVRVGLVGGSPGVVGVWGRSGSPPTSAGELTELTTNGDDGVSPVGDVDADVGVYGRPELPDAGDAWKKLLPVRL